MRHNERMAHLCEELRLRHITLKEFKGRMKIVIESLQSYDDAFALATHILFGIGSEGNIDV